jgi:class 3 adenylate cyclase
MAKRSINSKDGIKNSDELTCSEKVDDVINNSITWSMFVCFLTVWALFSDDVRLLCLPKVVDLPMLIVTLVILAIFLVEFGLCWAVSPGYPCSLGALMDLLAALSLIPFEELLAGVGGVGDSISVARVARAARALRILRATRAAAMALKTEARVRKVKNLYQNKEASVLADTLINSTNIKMLLGILVLLMGTTLLDHTETDTAADSGLEILDRIYGQQYLPSPSARNASARWTTLLDRYKTTVEGIGDEDSLLKLVKVQVWGVSYFSLPTDDIRSKDILKYKAGPGDRSIAWVSSEAVSQRRALFSLIMTIFSVLVIVTWAWSFRRDYDQLVIAPVNRMIEILKDMAMDPRQAVTKSQQMGGTGATEMDAIEHCIGKFGSLLKVGFGEAGMGIIARNIREEKFDPVLPGVIVKAVFGFCDIRHFTDCCEVLNEETMIFTNKIATIVHSLVEDSGGSVNKNIGDAFLCVWKLTEGGGADVPGPLPTATQSNAVAKADTDAATMTSKPSLVHHITGAEDTCDQAVHAFLQMHENLRTSPQIAELNQDARLQKKMPGFKVNMGSGLHLGWAIEGAVGTLHKVDATYLSPNVNMAARLEAATKQYGVSLLMSNSLVDNFTPQLRRECRALDRVTVKGSIEPIILYVHMRSEARELTDAQLKSFMETWQEAYTLYQTGQDWAKAARLMQSCVEILPDDKPAKVLIKVIEEAGGKAPDDWPGYRPLTSK